MQVETIVSTWIQASEGSLPSEPDLFFKFVAAWVAFNATYVYMYGSQIGDRAGALRFADESGNQQKHSECMREASYYSVVKVLAQGGVLNLKNNRRVGIGDPGNFHQVMAVLYAVRCNLFHGAKAPCDPRDQQVVEAAHRILTPHLSTSHLRLAA